MAVKQIVDFIENGNIVNSVNYPNIELGPKTEAHRIVLLHDANEGLSGQIIKVVETRGVVKQIASKVKGAFASRSSTLQTNMRMLRMCVHGVGQLLCPGSNQPPRHS
jgi:D-3-phosphoglycerate dehydrogenase